MTNASWHFISTDLEKIIDEHRALMRDFDACENRDKQWLTWFSGQGVAGKSLPQEAEPAVASMESYAALTNVTARRDAAKQERDAVLGTISAYKEKLAALAGKRLAYLDQHRKVRSARVVLSVLTVLVLGYAVFG